MRQISHKNIVHESELILTFWEDIVKNDILR
jgi:hypothetical protein